MGKPEEVDLRLMVFGSILIVLLLSASVVFFFIVYQRKLLAQQARLQQIQNEYQQQLLATSIDVQEKERARIGRDLHDEIGSSLSTVKLLINQIQWHDEESHKIVMNVKNILSDTIQNVRNLSLNIHPTILEKFGLVDALQNLISVVSTAATLNIDYQPEEICGLSYMQELALYRIVQELVNNTVKHAGATNLFISLKQSGEKIILLVKDDGSGFESNTTKNDLHTGIGLKSIEARAAMLQASVALNSEVGKGTWVEILLVLSDSI